MALQAQGLLQVPGRAAWLSCLVHPTLLLLVSAAVQLAVLQQQQPAMMLAPSAPRPALMLTHHQLRGCIRHRSRSKTTVRRHSQQPPHLVRQPKPVLHQTLRCRSQAQQQQQWSSRPQQTHQQHQQPQREQPRWLTLPLIISSSGSSHQMSSSTGVVTPQRVWLPWCPACCQSAATSPAAAAAVKTGRGRGLVTTAGTAAPAACSSSLTMQQGLLLLLGEARLRTQVRQWQPQLQRQALPPRLITRRRQQHQERQQQRSQIQTAA